MVAATESREVVRMSSQQKNSRPSRRRAAAIESLEGRRLMSVVVALQPKNVLVSVDSGNPSEVLATTKVKGLAKRESLVGIDFRPATGELFGVGSSSQLYRTDPTIAEAAYATNVGGAPSTRLYALDENLNNLVAIGSVGGGPASTNAGQLFTVGSLGIDPISFGGFDISTVNSVDSAYAAFRS